MWAAGGIADWWDEQHREAKLELDRFVDNNPNLFGVLVATAAATSMELGAGIVDTLRFGQGVAEGGIKGYGKDALRLIGLMGPLGRGAKMAQMSANAKLARLIVDPGGGVCGWVSGAQALRQTGSRAFVAVEDLAQALGTTLSELGGSRLGSRVEQFKQLGARISALRPVKTLDDVARMTRADGSITMFNIFGKRMSGGVLQDVGHAVYAFRDTFGRFRILDRGGSLGKTGEVFESLAALAKKYGLQGEWTLREAAVMENIFAKFMTAASSAPVFALDVFALAGANRSEHETMAQAFEVHKMIMRQGKPALEKVSSRYHVVASGDWLSKISQTVYGAAQKWPVIYEANRDVIGTDPSLIKPGQRLLIPVLPNIRGIK